MRRTVPFVGLPLPCLRAAGAVALAGMLSGGAPGTAHAVPRWSWQQPAAAISAAPGATWLLVISGVGGDAAHRGKFVDLSLQLMDAAVEKYGVDPARVMYLTERPELAGDRAAGRSTARAIRSRVAELSARAAPGDVVWVVLIGHGSSLGQQARFNLPGPDMGPQEFAELLGSLRRQRVVFINTASSSGAFVGPLAGPGRIIVTATRSGRQREEPVFARFFVDAFAGDGADLDKDGRISVLEAFRYATAEVGRFYETAGQLRTEQALLEDNGDGTGSMQVGEDGGDGALARAVTLGSPAVGQPGERAGDPVLQRLLATRAGLQARIEALRARKSELPEQEYLQQLEDLLVKLAEVDRKLRGQQGSEP